MTKHTPGPWANNGGCIEGVGGYPNVVCVVGIVNNQSRTDTANARLISAAPELLESLTGLLQRYTDLVNSGDVGQWDTEEEKEVMAARAAIAKAKGEK